MEKMAGAGHGATTQVQHLNYTTGGLCHGWGKYHSPNNVRDPRPLMRTTLHGVAAMLPDPVRLQKDLAPWAIFSELSSREHAAQRQSGRFWALWVDVDETAATFAENCCAIRDSLGAATHVLAYTTASATPERQKMRAIIPLAEPVSGDRYVLQAEAVNNRLEAAGITPDRATERAGQPCYLPNAGAFYTADAWGEHFLHPAAFDLEVQDLQEALRIEEVQRADLARLAAARRQQRAKRGDSSVVDAFNATFTVEDALQSYGYQRKGRRWLSPNSESGTPGVVVTPDGKSWLSSHQSDAGIGQRSDWGGWGDAFDLFVAYEHGGDFGRAVRDFACVAQGGGR